MGLVDHVAVHDGSLFSANAVAPARASADVANGRLICRWRSNSSSSVHSRALLRGRRMRPPAPGTSPRFASGIPKLAGRDATPQVAGKHDLELTGECEPCHRGDQRLDRRCRDESGDAHEPEGRAVRNGLCGEIPGPNRGFRPSLGYQRALERRCTSGFARGQVGGCHDRHAVDASLRGVERELAGLAFERRAGSREDEDAPLAVDRRVLVGPGLPTFSMMRSGPRRPSQ
jgi:hypothetical protein